MYKSTPHTRRDTSKVINMAWSFSEAYAFNGDISEWDTGKVRSLEYPFYDARAFNAGGYFQMGHRHGHFYVGYRAETKDFSPP